MTDEKKTGEAVILEIILRYSRKYQRVTGKGLNVSSRCQRERIQKMMGRRDTKKQEIRCTPS